MTRIILPNYILLVFIFLRSYLKNLSLETFIDMRISLQASNVVTLDNESQPIKDNAIISIYPIDRPRYYLVKVHRWNIAYNERIK